MSELLNVPKLKDYDKCTHIYTKCWGGYHCLECMTYFPKMIRPEPRGIINWDCQS